MPLQATSGAASYDAFGGGVPVVPNYIEDVFSTWLYTGNGSTQTITNGIDLAGKGGLTWIKKRSATQAHALFDTARGVNNYLVSNATIAQNGYGVFTDTLTAFNSTGFSLGADASAAFVNDNGATYASWTFREQPKFFDVVTYTGDGASPRTIAHSLGSTPGCIIIKRLDAGGDWKVHHRSISNIAQWLRLDSTLGLSTNSQAFTSFPDATSFYVGNNNDVNASGGTFVAYLFAHNAGGFGLSGTDNVISCGSYAGTGAAGNNVTLGYEAQWVLIKNTTSAGNGWILVDNMRGGLSETTYAYLQPNTSGAEVAGGGASLVCATATGFRVDATGGAFNASGDAYIYIAIRRGPMRTPTTGTSVYNGITRNGTGAVAQVTGVGFTPDLVHSQERSGLGVGDNWADRLRGSTNNLTADTTAAEFNQSNMVTSLNMDGMSLGTDSSWAVNNSSGTYINHFFRRAPGFFDEVCYTGTGVARTVAHNLGVAPELMIVKARTNGVCNWNVYHKDLGNQIILRLNTDEATQAPSNIFFNSTSPDSSNFTLGTFSCMNGSGLTYVAYLFASCPGVSKVGSYTGTGTTQTINCGFTGGARFVMVKRTDSNGNWMVVDTARGLVAAGDPTLYLNSTAAEVTGVDWLDPDSSGFIVNQEGTMNANVNAATYIYLAIS